MVATHYQTTFDLDAFGAQTPLFWSDTFGAPPVTNIVVGSAQSFSPLFADGLLRFVPYGPTDLVRGDCEQNGVIDIGDAIEILDVLFRGEPNPCLDTCDASGDGALDLGDAIYLLFYLFLGGAPPPAPFPDCGEALPGVGCDAYDFCP